MKKASICAQERAARGDTDGSGRRLRGTLSEELAVETKTVSSSVVRNRSGAPDRPWLVRSKAPARTQAAPGSPVGQGASAGTFHHANMTNLCRVAKMRDFRYCVYDSKRSGRRFESRFGEPRAVAVGIRQYTC